MQEEWKDPEHRGKERVRQMGKVASTPIHIRCKTDSHQEAAIQNRGSSLALCDDQKREGVGGGEGESRGRQYVYNYG